MRPWRNWQTRQIYAVLLQWRFLLDKHMKILYNIIAFIGDLILNSEKILRTCGEIGIHDRFGWRYYSGIFSYGCRARKKRQKIKYAGMAELADAPDLGSVTTVEFLLQRFAQFKICLTNRSLWRINAYAESH